MPRHRYEIMPPYGESAEHFVPQRVLSEEEEQEALSDVEKHGKRTVKTLPESEIMKIIRTFWQSRRR